MYRRIFTVAVAWALLFWLGSCTEAKSPEEPNTPTARAAAPADPTIVAAGDIACDPDSAYFSGSDPRFCQDVKTADRVRAINPSKVIVLGDTQYTDGTASEYAKSYSRSWGKDDIKPKTLPVVGNHEYHTNNAQGYRDYFAGMDLGGADFATSWKLNANWRIFRLNSNCSELAKPGVTGSCSGQVAWMKKTMTDSPNEVHHCCVPSPIPYERGQPLPRHDLLLAEPTTRLIEQAFYDKRGEIVLNGHAHSIEISNKITPGGSNSDRGVKHFTIGSGGKESKKAWKNATKPGWTDYRINSEHAVLKLTLKASSYDYQLINVDGKVLREGTRNCF